MTASNKPKTVRRVNQEGAGSWSNEMNIDQEIGLVDFGGRQIYMDDRIDSYRDVPLLLPSMHPMSRRPPDEMVAAGRTECTDEKDACSISNYFRNSNDTNG